MARDFRLAVVSVDNPDDDDHSVVISNCVAAITEAGQRGADLVVLPEEPDIIAGGVYGTYRLEAHPAFRAFQEQAAQSRIGVVASLSAKVSGPVFPKPGPDEPPRPGFGKTGPLHANTGFLLDRSGGLVGIYRKKHPAPSEEEIVTEQEDPFPVFDFEGVKLGIAICMDIHFPEMFRIYGLKGADVVCVPTMYLDYTGDMLEATEKARAIDNGMYVALSRYITKPFLAGKNMGYAKVIAPDGRIIASTGHKDGVVIAEFDPKWRMPFWGEGYGGNLRTMFETIRRPDLYGDLVKPKQ